MTFMFENLTVYRKAMEFVENIYNLTPSLTHRGKTNIIYQLQRAALSIPLNIAEGSGRIHKKEKRQFFLMARGSLHECIPLIQLISKIEAKMHSICSALYGNAEEIAKLLAGLIKSVKEFEQ